MKKTATKSLCPGIKFLTKHAHGSYKLLVKLNTVKIAIMAFVWDFFFYCHAKILCCILGACIFFVNYSNDPFDVQFFFCISKYCTTAFKSIAITPMVCIKQIRKDNLVLAIYRFSMPHLPISFLLVLLKIPHMPYP